MRTAWTNIGFSVMAAAALASSGCAKRGASGGLAQDVPAATAARDRVKPASVPSQSRELSVAKRPSLARRIPAQHDTAAIAGWIVYQGTPPKPKPINFGPEK